MKRLIHIGYYNDIEDIHAYAHLTTDEIVEKVKYGLGNFYPVKEMYDWSEIANLNYEVSTDGELLVLRDFPEDMSIIDNVNFHETQQWDYYIDVYRVLDFEDDETPSVKQAVTEQIISMLNNNIINENGNETFEGWCEDGAVFENTYEGRDKEFYEGCEKLMREVAPLVDKLTYDYLADC